MKEIFKTLCIILFVVGMPYCAVKCSQEGIKASGVYRGDIVVHRLNGERGVCIGHSIRSRPLIQFHSEQKGFYTVEILNPSVLSREPAEPLTSR